MTDWTHCFGQAWVCQICSHNLCSTSINGCPLLRNNSPGILPIPAAFPFFYRRISSSTPSRNIDGSSVWLCALLRLSSMFGSNLRLWLHSSWEYYLHLSATATVSVNIFPSLASIIVTRAWWVFVRHLTALYASLACISVGWIIRPHTDSLSTSPCPCEIL